MVALFACSSWAAGAGEGAAAADRRNTHLGRSAHRQHHARSHCPRGLLPVADLLAGPRAALKLD